MKILIIIIITNSNSIALPISDIVFEKLIMLYFYTYHMAWRVKKTTSHARHRGMVLSFYHALIIQSLEETDRNKMKQTTNNFYSTQLHPYCPGMLPKQGLQKSIGGEDVSGMNIHVSG